MLHLLLSLHYSETNNTYVSCIFLFINNLTALGFLPVSFVSKKIILMVWVLTVR